MTKTKEAVNETRPETQDVPNIVTMEDGSVVNFGTRAKLVSSQNIFVGVLSDPSFRRNETSFLFRKRQHWTD